MQGRRALNGGDKAGDDGVAETVAVQGDIAIVKLILSD
jgi:hypothetical protein